MQLDILKIKNYLKENNLTYEDLSKRSGVPLNTLKCIFSGRTPNPRIDTMQAITSALGISKERPLQDEPVDQSLVLLNIGDFKCLTLDQQKQVATVFNLFVSLLKEKQ